MKKIPIIVNLIILILALLFFIPKETIAQDTSLKPLIDLMNIFLSPGGSLQQSSFNLATPSPTLNQSRNNVTIQQFNNYVYYPQCDGSFDNIPLPNGCNVCQSGCGIVTSAMILSSLVDKKFTPDVVVNLYQQAGFYAGCTGSKISDARQIFQQNGLKTTDLLIYSTNSDALADFKLYLKNGWTIFALARFCDGGCSHFFWITDIDSNNNILAYDGFYGRKKLPPPLNESLYYPFPKYRAAFGMKKP